jgi:hypothetical protein
MTKNKSLSEWVNGKVNDKTLESGAYIAVQRGLAVCGFQDCPIHWPI